MNETARIVLLNGVGSAGKSSLAKALQNICAKPFLHVQMDRFLEMLPDTYQDHPDGISYEAVIVGGRQAAAIRTGQFGEQTLRGMRSAVAAMAAKGNDLIVDDVCLGAAIEEYRRLLSGFSLFVVGVFAPLDILEMREKDRGDRLIGLARWQYDRVHRNVEYDLEIDTSRASPMECAVLVRDRFRL